jgi:hypothetical protein
MPLSVFTRGSGASLSRNHNKKGRADARPPPIRGHSIFPFNEKLFSDFLLSTLGPYDLPGGTDLDDVAVLVDGTNSQDRSGPKLVDKEVGVVGLFFQLGLPVQDHGERWRRCLRLGNGD